MMPPAVHLVHAFSTFVASGPQLRMSAIMNALGGEFRHTILAMDGIFQASSRLTVEAGLEPPPPGSSWRRIVGIRDWIRRLRPSLVLTYNWGAIEALVGAWLAGVCPVIHNEHGFGPEEAARRLRRRVLAKRALLGRVDRLLVPSRSLYQIARNEYRLPPAKIRLIISGVDTGRFQPRADRGRRERLGVPADELLIGYVGMLRAEKNLPMLLRAFAEARLDRARLVLAGDGPCRKELEELSRSLGLGERVLFTGAIDDTPALYAALDIFALSSDTEQTPMALLEAMACGLPALATDVGDCRAILDAAGPPEIAAAGAISGYAEALRALAAAAALRSRLGEKNRRRCQAQYTVERMVREYAEVYREAVARR